MLEITQKLEELNQKAEELFGIRVQFQAEMNSRLTSTAGRAFYQLNLLQFSTTLYQSNKAAFLQDTVPHEFCHLLAFQLYGEEGCGHGTMWKKTMEALGYQPQRCHSYEVPQRKAKTTEYTCGCQVHHITPQRKAWMTRGKVYSCVKCGNVIKELV